MKKDRIETPIYTRLSPAEIQGYFERRPQGNLVENDYILHLRRILVLASATACIPYSISSWGDLFGFGARTQVVRLRPALGQLGISAPVTVGIYEEW